MQTHLALLSAATAGAIALFGVGVAVFGPAAAPTGGAPAAARPANAAAPANNAAAHPATTTAPAPGPSTTHPPAGSGALVGPDLSALSGMIQALATTSHNVTMKTSSSMVRGSVDPANGAAHAVAKSSGLEISEVVKRGSVFVKADLGANLNKQVGIKPGTWMRLDTAQIAADNQLLVQPNGADPVDMPGIMTGVTAIHQIDATHLAGTIDLTRIAGHTRPDPDEVKKSGAAAKKVPFTLTADALGRISNFTIDANAFDPILSLDVTYTDYGSGTAVATPPASVPAPQNVYSLFNN